MSVYCTIAGNYVNTSPYIVNYPFTVGFWAYPRLVDSAFHYYWALGSTNTGGELALYISSGNNWTLFASTDDVNTTSLSGGAATANRWVYICGQFFSATNRRIFRLTDDGVFQAALSSVSRTPSNATRHRVGARALSSSSLYADGYIAEFFTSTATIMPDAGAATVTELNVLAYQGPFVFPHLAASLVEYRSFRSSGKDRRDHESYPGRLGYEPLMPPSAVDAAPIAPHPPLPYYFKRPPEHRALGLI